MFLPFVLNMMVVVSFFVVSIAGFWLLWLLLRVCVLVVLALHYFSVEIQFLDKCCMNPYCV